MREIKFREWETYRKTMAVGTREDYDDSVGFRYLHGEAGKRILMQYTGLKDSHGKDVWFYFSRFYKETIAYLRLPYFLDRFYFSRFCKETIAATCIFKFLRRYGEIKLFRRIF